MIIGISMAISKTEIEKIAKLAKLSFNDNEIENLAHQMAEIIDYVKKINELNLEDVPPTYHVVDIKNVMREDECKKGLTQKEVLMNAPETHDGFISVPKVIRQISNQGKKG